MSWRSHCWGRPCFSAASSDIPAHCRTSSHHQSDLTACSWVGLKGDACAVFSPRGGVSGPDKRVAPERWSRIISQKGRRLQVSINNRGRVAGSRAHFEKHRTDAKVWVKPETLEPQKERLTLQELSFSLYICVSHLGECCSGLNGVGLLCVCVY